MPEQLQTEQPNLPSGYESAVALERQAHIDDTLLPWAKEPIDIGVSKCTVQGGETFLLASAISAEPRLVAAAEGMTEGQKRHADNMFYSRLPEVVNRGYSPNVQTVPNPTTDFPIYVMRNKSGQRLYFARTELGLPEESEYGPTIVRLAVCDKNKQALVAKTLFAGSYNKVLRNLD